MMHSAVPVHLAPWSLNIECWKRRNWPSAWLIWSKISTFLNCLFLYSKGKQYILCLWGTFTICNKWGATEYMKNCKRQKCLTQCFFIVHCINIFLVFLTVHCQKRRRLHCVLVLSQTSMSLSIRLVGKNGVGLEKKTFKERFIIIHFLNLHKLWQNYIMYTEIDWKLKPLWLVGLYWQHFV